jgi:tetratricopeptide (TPR) repeat protein
MLISSALSLHVYAYEFSSEFYAANEKYEAAATNNSSRNNDVVIEYGTQIINMLSSAPQNDTDVCNTLTTRMYEVARSYAYEGRYDESLDMYRKCLPYAKKINSKDITRIAEAKILQYGSIVSVYTDGGTSPDHNARNEKDNGVLFGLCSDGKTRSDLANESLILLYHELGTGISDWEKRIMKDAQASGTAVEFALNCPNEAADITGIKNKQTNLAEISDFLEEYKDVPIYLRFAAEFDIWSNRPDASAFRSAFVYVHDFFHRRNSNVAIVWSPSQASSWDVDADDFYPGDDSVDWVGMSDYYKKYFQGVKTWKMSDDFNEVVYQTGVNADPVLSVKHIVDTYGSRKPIMISESGFSHKNTKVGEDTQWWAQRKMQEFYGYLPMVYPQIKAIAYFDQSLSNEIDDYALSDCSVLKEEYLKQTKGARFIQDAYANNSQYCYQVMYDNLKVGTVFPVSCYAHIYGEDIKSVTYYVDDKYAGTSSEIPFTTNLNLQDYSAGTHTLKAVASGSKTTKEQRYKITLDKAISNIKVLISGNKVSFDQQPLIYNSRTMVPMRAIFEKLGCDVKWDQSTKTASGTKNGRTVKITADNTVMYVNSKKITLDTPPMVIEGRTLVPVRAIAEGLGCSVDWDQSSSTVKIEPKTFAWSGWVEEIPSDVDKDLYTIEEKEQYSYRTKSYFYTPAGGIIAAPGGNFVREDTEYGDWSSWSTNQASNSNKLEVETRTQSSPMKYHYAHWCTGNISDASNRYKTATYNFCSEATYHDLGWFDSPLPKSPDGSDDYEYDVDGQRQRCSNTCYRWYLVGTSGGNYTEYRTRSVTKQDMFYEYSDWSEYSDNKRNVSGGYGNNSFSDANANINDKKTESRTRTVYRYKEKG